MDREELKTKLSAYTTLEAEARQIREELVRLRAAVESPKAKALTGTPGGGSTGDPLLGPVAQIMGLEKRYRAKLERIYSAQAEIEDLIEPLPPKLRLLMRCRYIGGKRWEEVCCEIGFEWRQTHRLHTKALDMILEKMAWNGT